MFFFSLKKKHHISPKEDHLKELQQPVFHSPDEYLRLNADTVSFHQIVLDAASDCSCLKLCSKAAFHAKIYENYSSNRPIAHYTLEPI